MKKKLLVSLIILSPLFWFLIFISISLFPFYWRMANEPGLIEPIKLLWSYRILFSLGFAATAIINIIFISYREKRAWVLNLAASIFYIPIMILTLLMIV